ncbi:MAG: hypothetical protein ACOH14_00485 [Rhodoglobus sp.]
MKSQTSRVTSAIALVALASLAGCTPADFQNITDGSGSSDFSASTGEQSHVMSENLVLIEFPLGDEPVLAHSSNTRDSIDTSVFTPRTGRVSIYSDCIGTGRMTISLGNAVETSRDCRISADNSAHRDDLAIDAAGSYSVSVSMTEDQPWTVTVTELPQE